MTRQSDGAMESAKFTCDFRHMEASISWSVDE
jgi:hypothetical protein